MKPKRAEVDEPDNFSPESRDDEPPPGRSPLVSACSAQKATCPSLRAREASRSIPDLGVQLTSESM
jgi:hypothetical protein